MCDKTEYDLVLPVGSLAFHIKNIIPEEIISVLMYRC